MLLRALLPVLQVYERFGWRFNIINLACCWSKLADLFEPLGSRRMLRKERGALRQFLEQLLQDTAALLPSVDAGTAAALLDSMARLAACGKVGKSISSSLRAAESGRQQTVDSGSSMRQGRQQALHDTAACQQQACHRLVTTAPCKRQRSFPQAQHAQHVLEFASHHNICISSEGNMP